MPWMPTQHGIFRLESDIGVEAAGAALFQDKDDTYMFDRL